jgi:SpoVK/Ycf46/Vps4 family AAA+-type ATPase
MDGMEDSGAFVLLLTNRPASIDSAIIRDGRIGRRIRVGRPTGEEAEAIARLHLRGKPLACGHEHAASFLVGELYDPGHVLYRVRRRSSVGAGQALTLGHMASGAMIAGVVDRATSAAMRRSLEDEAAAELLAGVRDAEERARVTLADIRDAVRQVLDESRDVNHEQEIAEFTDGWEDEVVGVTRERARHADARAS